MPLPDATSNKNIAKRRSQRLLLRVPVQARRKVKDKEAAPEETETLAVNAHGAMILLKPPVADGEQLVLQNTKTSEEQICKVVFTGQMENGRMQVGIEFIAPAPTFWPVVFPPEDWVSPAKETRQTPKR